MGLKIQSATLDLCGTNMESLKQALDGMATDHICGLVIHGTSTEVEYHQLLDAIKAATLESLGKRIPVTLIPQYLLPKGGFSLEVYSIDSCDAIHLGEHKGVGYGLFTNERESLLFFEGVPSSNFSASVRQQSDEIFAKIENTLSMHGFAVDDIVRQWNYIGDIVALREGKQNYQEFNDARSHYYSKGCWSNGYPAATGIGASCEGVIVGGIAFKTAVPTTKRVYPIDNPLQVAAHVYSKSVLIDDAANAIKSTPKFERAKVIETERGVCCFVSGTAAIRGEASMEASSASLQTKMTIENIQHLVSKDNLVRYGCKAYDLRYAKLHVFVKHAEDFAEVKDVVDKAYPEMEVVYTVADICRGELLVEIEGILIS